MVQARPRPNELWHGMERQTRPVPNLAARFVNHPWPGLSLVRRFITGLAPSLAIATLETHKNMKQPISYFPLIVFL